MMKRSSFFTKLFLGNLLLIGVIVVISGIASYSYLNANYQQEIEEQQSRTARMMQEHFRNIWPSGENEINAQCVTLFEDASMRLTVIDDDGRVLGDSQADPKTMANHKTDDRPEILAALQGKSGKHVRTSETMQVEYRYFAEPIEINEQIVGTVRLAMPIRAMAEGSSLIRNYLFLSACMGAIIAGVLAFLLSWIWYLPLRRITLTARKIASGNISSRVHISGSGELVQLGNALNDMAGSLADKINQVTVQRSNLNTVVSNLQEGVVALDSQGCVVLMNTSARNLLEVVHDNTKGRQLQEVVRIADVVTAFIQVKDSGEFVSKQIERLKSDITHTLDLLAVRITEPSAEGIHFLLVVRDITELARTAKIKSEFASNASHELRTPLAIIRAAVDTLDTIGPDNQHEFKKVRDMLDRHTGRLEEMTDDLLSLHTIETAEQQLRIDEVEVDHIIDWSRELFSTKAKEKNITLDILVESHLKTFTIDLTLLRLILQNLLDNAIKFTPEGGRIKSLMQVTEDYVLLRVSDTGCGIPLEFQDRIFERFFQVDTARSGDARTRGTGLGLAIVKHAAERLGGEVTLQSEMGKGSVVEIRLPISSAQVSSSD